MKKIIIATIIVVAVTILLLSATNKPQIQTEQPERTQPIITTAAVTTALEAKESIATVTATAKLTTSITTTAPVNTATTTAVVTTSEKLNARVIHRFINSLTAEGTNQNTGKGLAKKTMVHYLYLHKEDIR